MFRLGFDFDGRSEYELGEIADEMIERQIWGSPRGSFSTYAHQTAYNKSLSIGAYKRLMSFLTSSLSHEKRLPNHVAKKLIVDNLIKRGKFPYPRVSKLNTTELVSMYNIITKDGLSIEDYDDDKIERLIKEDYKKSADIKYSPRKPKPSISYEEAIGGENMLPKTEVKTTFELRHEEEGEKILTLTRGMLSEAVAVSYSYPHYRKQGFYAETKSSSSIFKKEEAEKVINISMGGVFSALAETLNNLLSADKLTEETYNNLMDGYEPFILEALAFEEIEPLLDVHRGLKNDRKKRISNTTKISKK